MKTIPGFLILAAVSTALPQVEPSYTDHNLSTFTIPISDWNMVTNRYKYLNLDPNSTPAFPPDLDPANIVGFQVAISNDANDKYIDLTVNRIGTEYWGGSSHMICYPALSTCQVYLDRGTNSASRFVLTSYDGPGHRGYVTIQYHSPNGVEKPQLVNTYWKEIGPKSMDACVSGSECFTSATPSEINAGNLATMDAFIRSDKEPTEMIASPVTSLNHSQNIAGSSQLEAVKGRGGVLSWWAGYARFKEPINQFSNGNWSSKFNNSRYDNTSINRGHIRLRYIAPTTADGRQPFVVKSKYRKIGTWCISTPGCDPQKNLSTTNFFSNPERILSAEASVLSDFDGSSIAVSNFRRTFERSEEHGIRNMIGAQISGEIGAQLQATTGTIVLNVMGRTVTGSYWYRFTHSSSTSNRGWVKLDYMAAKCGEGGNGIFTSAANIGYTTPPNVDCNGYAVVDGIATHVLESQGMNINGTADQFRFLYKAGTYNMTLVGKVDQVEITSANALGCLMFRKDATSGSPNVAACRTGDGRLSFQYRSATNGSTSQTFYPHANYPDFKWIKLVKSVNTFTLYVSDRDDKWDPNSSTGWIQVASRDVAFSSSYLYGIGASSNDSYNPATVGILGVKTL